MFLDLFFRSRIVEQKISYRVACPFHICLIRIPKKFLSCLRFGFLVLQWILLSIIDSIFSSTFVGQVLVVIFYLLSSDSNWSFSFSVLSAVLLLLATLNIESANFCLSKVIDFSCSVFLGAATFRLSLCAPHSALIFSIASLIFFGLITMVV